MVAGAPRPVEWIGSARADLRSFPEAVRDVVGYALYQAQIGLRHRDVKSLRGFGSTFRKSSHATTGMPFERCLRSGSALPSTCCMPSGKGQAGHRDPDPLSI